MSCAKIVQIEDNTRIAKIRIAIPSWLVFIVECRLSFLKERRLEQTPTEFRESCGSFFICSAVAKRYRVEEYPYCFSIHLRAFTNASIHGVTSS